MRFCTSCGKEITEGQKFCSSCGAPVVEAAPVEEVVVPVPVETAPVVVDIPAADDSLIREEQEFLDGTYRILRWEQKAWSIFGKVFTIIGSVFAGIFLLVAFIGLIGSIVDGGGDAAMAMTMGLLYGLIYGGMFLVIGIISIKAAKKIPFYLNKMYSDFSVVDARCGSVGMIVFSAFFCNIALVFYIINFARIKANRRVIERIIARQKGIVTSV